MTAIDPHRTLGLTPGASQAEIKRAYRYLAKLYHPDSAGERALPRFLAIQAAYEALVEDPARRRLGGRAGSTDRAAEPQAHPWQADASRARATREAYRARTRRGAAGAGSSGSASDRSGAGSGSQSGPGTAWTRGARPGSGSTGAGDARSSAGSAGADGSTGSRGQGAAPGSSGPTNAGRSRRNRGPKATIGSTSYDGADKEPFDPTWEGATWYGAGSGTYWTLNPKEYADPRKHGPEYLARSRRSRSGATPDRAMPGDPAGDIAPAGPTADDFAWGPSAPSESAESGEADSVRGADARPWPPAAATGSPPAADHRAHPTAHQRAGTRTARPDPRPAPSAVPPVARGRYPGPPHGRVAGSAGIVESAPAGIRRASLSLPGRIGLAVLGWIPLGVAISLASQAVPACSGVVSVCSDPLKAGIWPIHLLLIALLVVVPRLGAIAAYGAGAFLLAGFAATPVLLALGGARTPAGSAMALGIVVIAAWIGGVVLALSGRVELPPWRGSRLGGPRVR